MTLGTAGADWPGLMIFIILLRTYASEVAHSARSNKCVHGCTQRNGLQLYYSCTAVQLYVRVSGSFESCIHGRTAHDTQPYSMLACSGLRHSMRSHNFVTPRRPHSDPAHLPARPCLDVDTPLLMPWGHGLKR